MSNRKKARAIRTWRHYTARYDRLVRDQRLHRGLLSQIRITPGYFRAEGWSARSAAYISKARWPR